MPRYASETYQSYTVRTHEELARPGFVGPDHLSRWAGTGVDFGRRSVGFADWNIPARLLVGVSGVLLIARRSVIGP